MCDRGETVKYKVKVPAPDSTTDFDTLLSHLFEELGCFGYVRFTNETRWYRDPKVNERYQHAIKKKKVSQFKDDGEEYDKFIWIKLSLDAHEILSNNMDKLNYYYGVTKMTVEIPQDRGDKRNSQGQLVPFGTDPENANQVPLGPGPARGRRGAQHGDAVPNDEDAINTANDLPADAEQVPAREDGAGRTNGENDIGPEDYDEMMQMEINNTRNHGQFDTVMPDVNANNGGE